MTFKHHPNDVVITCRFRKEVYRYLSDCMKERPYKKRKTSLFGIAKDGSIKKSIHTVLDEKLRELMDVGSSTV